MPGAAGGADERVTCAVACKPRMQRVEPCAAPPEGATQGVAPAAGPTVDSEVNAAVAPVATPQGADGGP